MSWRGLYAITDTALTRERGVVHCVRAAVAGGAAMVQYRDKSDDARRRRAEATALLGVCRDSGVPLIINDDVALAAAIGADGVHVGRDDGGVADARARLGPRAIVGASCYHHLDLAMEAAAAGASYVAFGRVFPSRTKPGAALADATLVREARSRLDLPIAVIGGVTAENSPEMVSAGADLLAVINDLWTADDPRARAAEYATGLT